MKMMYLWISIKIFRYWKQDQGNLITKDQIIGLMNQINIVMLQVYKKTNLIEAQIISNKNEQCDDDKVFL